jgi:hypothetical protein
MNVILVSDLVYLLILLSLANLQNIIATYFFYSQTFGLYVIYIVLN